MEELIKRFKERLAKIKAYNHAIGVLYYDSETVMPRAASDGLGKTLGVLSEQVYNLTVDESFKADINEILAHKDEVDFITRREAEELSEELEQMASIPVDEYVAFQVAVNDAGNAWHEAKEKSDYSIFEPHLAKLVDYTIRFAKYQKPDMPVYDALLDKYEKGLNVETLDRFFMDVRSKLVPVIQDIAKKGRPIDDSFLNKKYDIAKQREFSEYLMDVLTLDKSRCVLGETEHPFTTDFTKNDVRITTHYHESMVASSMYSVIHEGGHALYEQNIGDDIKDSPLGGGSSMGIHESQSRLYENLIGRSEEFISYIFPKMQELFPEQLKGVTAHDMYLAVNKSVPSLIRTEADELTYPLHIMVRYELEKKLMTGEISTKQLPLEWNRLYKEYLGVDVPNDREGLLQDSHWSGASFGYFPSYAIGSAYGVQMIEAMKKDIDVFGLVRAGDIKPIVNWLTDRIYKYGCLYKPNELVKNACGADFDPSFYTDYLEKKFRTIYDI